MKQGYIDTHSARHYFWGENCEAWIFVETETLSVKQESMPPDSRENLHFHNEARQFFYVLQGRATFYLESEKIEVNQHQGLEITPKFKHYIANETSERLDFLLISQPNTKNDRINI
jgi:mannose-6-phosphate isomerase-like protein (cupin superfamily)